MSVEEIRQGVERAISENDTAKNAEWATHQQVSRIGEAAGPLLSKLIEVAHGLNALYTPMTSTVARVESINGQAAHAEFSLALRGASQDVVDRIQSDLAEADRHDAEADNAVVGMTDALSYIAMHVQSAIDAFKPEGSGDVQFAASQKAASTALDAAALSRERANVEALGYVHRLTYGDQ